MVHRGWSRGIWFCATIASLGVGCGGNAIDAASSAHPERDAARDARSTLSSGGRSGAAGTGGRSGDADASLPASGGSSSTIDAQAAVAPCQCPRDAFFVEVRGDGNPVVLSFGGAQTPPMCEAGSMPNTPTGAATKSCGIFVFTELSACKGPNHAPPCVNVQSNARGFGTYVDAMGRSWNIDALSLRVDDAGTATNGAFRGHYDAQVSRGDGGLPVDLSGNLYVCGSLIDVLSPCH